MTASNLRNIVFVIRQSAQICSTSSRGRNNFPQFWADFSSRDGDVVEVYLSRRLIGCPLRRLRNPLPHHYRKPLRLLIQNLARINTCNFSL
jgi:hypothetical protein